MFDIRTEIPVQGSDYLSPILGMRGRPRSVPFGPHPNRVRELREAQGLSQDELGDRIGMSGSGVGKLERGHVQLKAALMDALSKALHCHRDDLLASGSRITPRKRALLELLDQLTEEEQDQLLRIGATFSKSPAQPVKLKKS